MLKAEPSSSRPLGDEIEEVKHAVENIDSRPIGWKRYERLRPLHSWRKLAPGPSSGGNSSLPSQVYGSAGDPTAEGFMS